jgi:multidrug efflux pump subunit AcrB
MHTAAMLRLLLSCLVVLLALPALADECALDAKAITAQFSARLPKGAKVLSTKKEQRKVKQVLKLADGVEVTVDFGGCERVQYSFGIKAKGLTTKTVGAEAMAVARRVLPGLPMSKEAMAEPKVIMTAVDEGSFVSLPATLSCGPGTCRFELVPVQDKKRPAAKKPPTKKPDAKDGKPPDEEKVDDAEQPATLVLSYDAAI